METLWQDLRYGARMLARNPGFTTVAVLTLALGIGANTAIFSVVNAVLLRPLSFENPDELVMVWETNPETGNRQRSVSYANFRDWQEQNQVFEAMAVMRFTGFTLKADEEAERVEGARVSTRFFSLLGVEPVLGRTFLPEDDLQGAEDVVILSHGLWQRRYGGDRSLLGKRLTIDGTAVTLVGVLPADFQFPAIVSDAELWTPVALDHDFFRQRSMHMLRTVARLKPGVALEQAQAEMDTVAARIAEQYPDSNAGRGVNLIPLDEQVVGDVRPALLVLQAAVGLVLLIACANVANLLLARGTARQKEMAIRAALGAGRARLVRQLLTESILLGLGGGAVGLLVALWGLDALVALVPGDVPRLGEIGIDRTVLYFALAASVLTGLVFGLAPAFNASRPRLHDSLKEGSRTSGDSGSHCLRGLLVVAEIAFTLVLLVGAGLLGRSFLRLLNVDPGFHPENVLTFRVSKPINSYDEEQRAAFYDRVLERVRALPGALFVGGTSALPLSGRNMGTSFFIEGRPAVDPTKEPLGGYNSVTPDYFRAMGIPLLGGRPFNAGDSLDAPPVIIIDDDLAQRFFAGQDPIGQRMRFGISFRDDDSEVYYEIVGVVGTVRRQQLEGGDRPQMYISSRQQTWPWMAFVVRAAGDPLQLAAAVRTRVAAVDPDEPVFALQTMNKYLNESVAQRRFSMLLLGSFAAVALMLAAVGIYGVISYSVSQRTHEIGIRMALGAQPRDIFKLVVGQGMLLALIGVGVGLAASFALTRFLESLLFGVSATDPVTFAGVAALLAAVALLACYVPARRATRVDPMVALRYE